MDVTTSARSERGAAALPLAVVLAVVAVLVVLTAAVVAGLGARGGTDTTVGDSDPTAPDTSASEGTTRSEEPEEEPGFFPDGQVLTGDRRDNANVEVPSVEDGWVRQQSSYVIGYAGRDGLAQVGVTGPALWRSERCGDDEENPRAWVGFTAPVTSDGEPDVAGRAVGVVVEDWERTIARSRETLEVSEVETGTTTVSDGTEAATAAFTFRTSGEDAGCFPPAYELRFLALETGDYSAVLVLQRGVAADGSDVRGHLDAETADTILASARRQQER